MRMRLSEREKIILVGAVSLAIIFGLLAFFEQQVTIFSSTAPLTAMLTGLTTFAGVVATLLLTNRREVQRQEHQQSTQQAELEEQRLARLREERLRVYATLNKISSTFDPKEYRMSDLKESLSEIELLTDDRLVLEAAKDLVGEVNQTRKLVREVKKNVPEHDPANDPKVKQAVRAAEAHREYFVEKAKKELSIK